MACDLTDGQGGSADLAGEVGVSFLPCGSVCVPPEAMFSVKEEGLPHRRGPGFTRACEQLSSLIEPRELALWTQQPQPLDVSQFPDGSFHGTSHACPGLQFVIASADANVGWPCGVAMTHSIRSARCGVGTEDTTDTHPSMCQAGHRATG